MATVSSRSSARSASAGQSRRGGDANSASDLRGSLDGAYASLSRVDFDQDQFHGALDALILNLRELKHAATEERWVSIVDECRRHPIAELLHEDPFTRRAFSKPRGYAGDAELLDYIYAREEMWPTPRTTSIGQRVFDYTTTSPAAAGVRSRRGFIANMIDRLAERIEHPHVLSIAAGHLREASLTSALKRRKLGRFTALDADELSLQEVRNCYGRFGVDTIATRIKDCLSAKLDLGSYDFVYSMGLFDYLGEAAGRRLVLNLFQMLRPGGQLLVTNFLPYVRDVGYMEAFMDWRLIYRSRQEMISLTMEIPQSDIGNIVIFAEENQNIIFLKITRK